MYPAHQNTVSATPARLAHLAGTDPLAAADWDGKLASTEVDYLAENGAELERAIERDVIAKTRLGDALGLFCKIEGESRELVEGVMGGA